MTTTPSGAAANACRRRDGPRLPEAAASTRPHPSSTRTRKVPMVAAAAPPASSEERPSAPGGPRRAGTAPAGRDQAEGRVERDGGDRRPGTQRRALDPSRRVGSQEDRGQHDDRRQPRADEAGAAHQQRPGGRAAARRSRWPAGSTPGPAAGWSPRWRPRTRSRSSHSSCVDQPAQHGDVGGRAAEAGAADAAPLPGDGAERDVGPGVRDRLVRHVVMLACSGRRVAARAAALSGLSGIERVQISCR